MNLFDWIRLFVLSLLWGGSYIWIEYALLTVSPLTIVFFRVFMAALFLLCFCLILKLNFKINKRLFLIFLMMSLFNNVIPFNLIAWGQSQITASVSSILNATTPLFTVIIANYWPKPNGEKATLNRIIGVLIGICGVSILMGFSFDDIDNSIKGQIAILLAAISYAISALFGKQISGNIHPAVSATMMLCISSIILLPIILFIGFDFKNITKIHAIIPILGLSIFSTAIAYLIFYKLIKTIGSNVMLVTLLMPISAIFMSIIFLGETIAKQHIVGLFMILTGLVLVDGRMVIFIRSRL
ncbi:MAG: DMT family transporter [Hyphomicrobiales bacterium]|jgi:drug/metabolite transporter (DMT)-like permease|nr:DMT family transporter [Hyphomicrobiales bacterium]